MRNRWVRSLKAIISVDLLRVRRSRAVVVGTLLFTGLCIFGSWYPIFPAREIEVWTLLAYDSSGNYQEESTPAFIYFHSLWLQPFIAAMAVLLGSGAIAGQLQSGYSRTLQTLPCSRAVVVFGIAVTRSLIGGAITAVGLTFGAVTILIRFGTLDATSYLLFVAATVLLAVGLTVSAVGVSAAVRTRIRALFLTLGPMLIAILLGADSGFNRPIRSLLFVQPYQTLVSRAHERLVARARIEPYMAELNGTDVATLESTVEVPFYLTDAGAALTLVLIPTVVLLVGGWRYTRRDL